MPNPTTSTMKLILLFSAFFLLSSLTTLAAAEVVLDRDGNELRRGVEYYIYPGITDVAGGLTLASRNHSCPLDVTLAISPTSNGLPLTFLPADPEEDTINTSTDLNIVFSAVTICVQSTVWKLDFDDAAGRFYVTTGGVAGNPGRETLANWFKIENDRGAYKLVFCPTVCDICKPVCGNLGVYREDGRLWLGINSDAPLPVEFRGA
ncbi:miraculin-like [Phoenix dactylifera]|uniref:Miraculin n=1 Tax=Phoenix dactylifera TaxID=42345 RepID=A0A8B7BJP9_PHODC|nr:miraculin [Phoenix dactylifera]XP_038973880.1 miraculin-like [Phoenix dactylifera]